MQQATATRTFYVEGLCSAVVNARFALLKTYFSTNGFEADYSNKQGAFLFIAKREGSFVEIKSYERTFCLNISGLPINELGHILNVINPHWFFIKAGGENFLTRQNTDLIRYASSRVMLYRLKKPLLATQMKESGVRHIFSTNLHDGCANHNLTFGLWEDGTLMGVSCDGLYAFTISQEENSHFEQLATRDNIVVQLKSMPVCDFFYPTPYLNRGYKKLMDYVS